MRNKLLDQTSMFRFNVHVLVKGLLLMAYATERFQVARLIVATVAVFMVDMEQVMVV